MDRIPNKLTLQAGHLLTMFAHIAHKTEWPHGLKETTPPLSHTEHCTWADLRATHVQKQLTVALTKS